MSKFREWLDETHGQGFELLRHFLLRFFDSDLITSPGQMTPALIGAFSVFLPWFPLVIGPLKGKYAYLSSLPSPQPYMQAVRADELWLITLMMSSIGLLTAIKWQSVLPNLRDLRSLASLPIRPYKVFLAKLLALVLVATAVIFILNLFPTCLFPVVSGSRWALGGSPLHRMLGLAISCVAGSYFALFSFILVQGFLLTLLRPRTFARISGHLQALSVPAMLAVIVLSFSIQPRVLKTVLHPEFATWLPPVWFLGLCQRAVGDSDPALATLAHRAVMALLLVVFVTLCSYLVSYHRYQAILLTGASGPRANSWLFGVLQRLVPRPRCQAVVAFVVKTLSMSSQHRTILTGYIGAALAILISGLLGVHSIVTSTKAMAASFIYAHVILTIFLLVGLRHLFSIPVELRANWVFQLTEGEGRREWLSAIDALVLGLGVVGLLLVPFPLELKLLGWLAVKEALLLAAFVVVCFEALFHSWEKLPFTCSHLPGKVPMWIRAIQLFAILGFLPAVNAVLLACLYHEAMFYAALILLLGAAVSMHVMRNEARYGVRFKYEELPEPAVQSLNLLK